MFSLRKPPFLLQQLEAARDLPLSYASQFNTQDGRPGARIPAGYTLDHTRSQIGHGPEAFETAKSALHQWQHFDLGWVESPTLAQESTSAK